MSISFFTLFILGLSGLVLIVIYRVFEVWRQQPLKLIDVFRRKTEPTLKTWYHQIMLTFVSAHFRSTLYLKNHIWRPIVRFLRQLTHRSTDFLAVALDYLYRRFAHWYYSRRRKK